METFILALDQGTTSSRAIVFDRVGEIVSVGQREFPQIYPRPGWVEHDPEAIWKSQLESAQAAVRKARISPRQVLAIGLTNQRETVVLWERAGGRPVHNAIVWQCRRSADLCETLKRQGAESLFRERTGLLPDPYFSGTKIAWILDNVPGVRARAEKGELAFGTIDSWLLYKLTGEHVTEPANASRTLLFNIHKNAWDDELLQILRIPRQILPTVKPSMGLFGTARKDLLGVEVPVAGALGDQQAALFGQAGFAPGSCKCTYGTGCFALLNTGKTPAVSKNRLLTTIAWDLGDGPVYALEGSVFIAGAVVQWLRDEMRLVDNAAETEAIARSVPDSGGVYMVPAFVGLGAPYWDPDVRGAILGLTRGTTPARLVRAALESVAFQCKDLIDALRDDSRKELAQLNIDGGASVNGFLAQFQADILGIPVVRPRVTETTALGAACVAGLAMGYWKGLDALPVHRGEGARFAPAMAPDLREKSLGNWAAAVKAARTFRPEY